MTDGGFMKTSAQGRNLLRPLAFTAALLFAPAASSSDGGGDGEPDAGGETDADDGPATLAASGSGALCSSAAVGAGEPGPPLIGLFARW
jgi:hypothetical protein